MEQVTDTDRTIITTRIVHAPCELVFRAWTDGAVLSQWWGPKGFTNTFHRFEPRPGGAWNFTMHGPDGKDYHNECVFVEIIPGRRVVFDHLRDTHFYHAEVDLSDRDGGTLITWSMRFDDAEECRKLRPFIEAANEENIDRMMAVLTRSASTHHNH